MVSLGRRPRATGRPEKCIFHAPRKKNGQKRPRRARFRAARAFHRVVGAGVRTPVRPPGRPDSGGGPAGRPARFGGWSGPIFGVAGHRAGHLGWPAVRPACPARGPRAGHLVRTRKKRSGPRSGPQKTARTRKKRSGPFGPATLARLAGPLWGGGPARFRGGPDGWPARFVGRSGPIGGVVRPDLWGGPARFGGWSGPIWGVVRTGGRRSGHPPDRVEPTTYRTPVPT